MSFPLVPVVYFVGAAPVSPLVKIGYTRDLPARFDSLCSGSPVPLTLLAVVPAVRCREAEEALHEMFAAERAHGEWFDLGSDPMAAVMARTGDLDEWVVVHGYGEPKVKRPREALRVVAEPEPQAAPQPESAPRYPVGEHLYGLAGLLGTDPREIVPHPVVKVTNHFVYVRCWIDAKFGHTDAPLMRFSRTSLEEAGRAWGKHGPVLFTHQEVLVALLAALAEKERIAS